MVVRISDKMRYYSKVTKLLVKPKLNGDLIVVHAQVRICPFYEKQGYIQFGQIDDDEGVPHMWMKKKIQY